MSQLVQTVALTPSPSSKPPKQRPPSSVNIFPLIETSPQNLTKIHTDLLGSVAFTPVKNDMTGNITKVRTRYLAHPLLSKTLQGLVRSELSQKQHKATEGLLWLTRGLDFTAQALRQDLLANSGILASDDKPKQELADSFKASYKETLAPHHSFLIKPVFNMAMSATPYRREMYRKIVGEGTDEAVAQKQMEVWVAALEERVRVLKEFMASREAKW